ncbi:MAG: hypothetical protein Q7S40_25485 [Opitutaceae bacterium]|nr:hypothetical protein [Opitutaceae bacterium]
MNTRLRLFWLSVLFAPAGFCASDAPRPAREPGAGLLYYAKADYAFADNAAVIANPYICGALFQVIWSEVEKTDGHCDWGEVDRWIKPWLDAKKSIAIRIMWVTSGAWPKPYYKTPTPKWVWEKGAKFAFLKASRTEIPLVWDPIYKKYARRFLETFAARYGDSPWLLFADVTPGAETNPYRFGLNNPANLAFKDRYAQAKASDGRSYSEELWLETVKEWIDAAGRALPKTPLLVTLNVGSLRGTDRLREIGDYAVSKGCYVGQNGLGGRSYQDPAAGRMQAFLGWSQRTKLFFEMAAGTGGRTGTLLEVMQAAGRIHCDYLNVYPEDVRRGTRGQKNFDPAYEATLKYGAERLGRH